MRRDIYQMLSKEWEITSAVEIFHFILLQITFHLTNVILNISEPRDGWAFLFSPKKQSNIFIFGAQSKH